MSSDAGYGYICKFSDLMVSKKAGKAALTLPKGAKVMPPLMVENYDQDQIVAVTNEGRMLVFPIKDLPTLAKGKGNKIIGIPSGRVMTREEFVISLTVVPPEGKVKVHSGKRHLLLKSADLAHYVGERGRRGSKLPRGFQRVDALTLEGE